MYIIMLTELREVLDKLQQGTLQNPQRLETSDTSGEKTDTSEGRRKNLSNKTYRMEKEYGATQLGRFFMTGLSDAANVQSNF